jgi:tRNA threonylcarbamoyladenosine biosynthesis protein TsaE
MLLRTRRDTQSLGKKIAASLAQGDLVLLDGELGTGKTFLARAILGALGVQSDAVASPTFNLVHEHRTPRGIVLHADLYRLLDSPVGLAREVSQLGLREQRADGAILVVEWGARAQDDLGGLPAIAVELTMAAGERRARVTGERAREVGA